LPFGRVVALRRSVTFTNLFGSAPWSPLALKRAIGGCCAALDRHGRHAPAKKLQRDRFRLAARAGPIRGFSVGREMRIYSTPRPSRRDLVAHRPAEGVLMKKTFSPSPIIFQPSFIC
jgi:hypothetical protein